MFPGGCGMAIFKCPPLVTYSKEFQQQAATELDALKASSRLSTMIVDYSKIRDACRMN